MDRLQADILEIIENEELFSQIRNATVFVTGATGLVGSMIIKSIIAANIKYDLNVHVYGQIRNENKAKLVFGDLYDSLNFVTDMQVDSDYIIHTVSPTASKYFIDYPVETIKTSVNSTIEALELAKKTNASMVYLSSMEEYGIPYISGETMTEDKIGVIDHLNIRSSYSESKRLCECLCSSYSMEYGVDVKIARLAQTFGAGVPLSDNRMPMQFANAVVNGNDIVLHTDGKSISNFVYLTDAISGILYILFKGLSGQAYNVCNDKETRSVCEIAELVSKEVANKTISVRFEKKDNMGYAPNVIMYLNSEKLKSLNWIPNVGMKEAYERLVEYIKEAT